MMRAGSLDRRIKIIAPTEVEDGVGDELATWREVLCAWASKRELGSPETLRNPQISAELDAIFTIRTPRVALDTRMRIQDDADRLYEIRSVSELPGRREGLEIQARGLDKLGAAVPAS